MRRFSKFLVISGALLICYAFVGFLIAPALVRYFGENYLRENFSPESSISKVRINPFTGSFRVEGLKLADDAGAWSVAWQEAELNISSASLIKFYPVVDAVRLNGADLRYELKRGPATAREESANPNGSDWRERVKDLNLAKIPKVRVDLLEISGGRMEFSDQTAARNFRKTVDPINFTLRDFTTVVENDSEMRFVAETDAGATLSWKGDFRSQPIRSSGKLTLSNLAVHDLSPYYDPFIRFDLKRAVFGLDFDYQLDLSDMEDLFQIENGSLSLTEVLCQPIDQNDRLISVDSVMAEGIGFRFPAMALEIPTVEVAAGATRVFRDADGKINLGQLVALPPSSEKPAVEPPTGEGSLPALSYRIGGFTLSDYRIVWEQALDGGMASLGVGIPKMKLSGLTSDLESPFRLTADFQIGPSGTAHVQGSIAPAPPPSLDLSIQIKEMPLPLLSAYAQSLAKTEIAKGTFDFDGRFQYDLGGVQALSGDGAVNEIALVYDKNLNADWAALDLKGLRLNLSPFELAMNSLSLEQPEIVYTQTSASAGGEAAAESAESTQTDQGESGSGPAPVRIDAFTVAGGRLTFIDETMGSAAPVEMDTLALDLNGLDLSGSQPAEIALSAQINGSPLQIDGVFNALHFKEKTRLKASLSGLSLPAFSRYSGQAVGRRIASGSFNLESDWKIVSNQLEASNRIRIEALKLGDKVRSENAVNLPLDLAVTLLKGPNGVMELSLPLSGDLSEPKVGIGQIVRTAMVGVITSAASAPFKLLSGLVGAKEDLSSVRFNPGSSELIPSMVSRLNDLATALKERPGLTLTITPQVSQADKVKLSEEKLRIDLFDGSDPGDEKLYRQRLTKRYREAMEAEGRPDAETAAEEEAGVEEMVAALLPGVELPETDLADLAAARAGAIQKHLMTVRGITPERLNLSEPEIGTKEAGARFDLK